MKRGFFLLLFLGAIGCSTAKVQVAEKKAEPEHLLVSGCTIQDTSGKLLWSYPDWLCLFLPDGRFVSGGLEGITLHGADQKTIWRVDVKVHHMMSLAANGEILALDTEWKTLNSPSPPFESTMELLEGQQWREIPRIPKKHAKEKFRVDRIVRISPEGKVVAERSFFNDPEYLIKKLKADYTQKKTPLSPTPFEATHFNSIYEIGPNSSPIPAFKAGNVIVNDNEIGKVLILDPEFKHILWRLPMDLLGHRLVHDVQVLPSGQLLFFRNAGLQSPVSSLERVDPVTLVNSWKFIDPSPQGFHVPDRGSVQELPEGRHLFSYSDDTKSWAKILDANNKLEWEREVYRNYGLKIQGAYLLPVESFLAHNRKL